MEQHNDAVRAISRRVREFYAVRQPYRIYHGSTNTTRTSNRRPDNTVDVSSLGHVLDVDVARQTALVEPNVPMDRLVAATLARGLVPLVVMEFPGITVGGGFSGMGGESSTFKHGLFEATVNWIEIVIPNGEIMTASRIKDENTDLFWGAASAFGTLGVVTLLEVQLQPAKPYVQLTYSLQPDAAAMRTKIEEETKQESTDFVDAIIFAQNSIVVCSGVLSDSKPEEATAQRFTRPWDPWFYIHVRRLQERLRHLGPSDSHQEVTEWVPLTDYLFRYDRGAFWVGRYSFSYFLVPFNRLTRLLLDPFMHTRTMYRALHKSGLADFYLIQDVSVPFAAVPEFAAWLDATFHIRPLWVCPLRFRRTTPNARHGLHAAFGAAAAPPTDRDRDTASPDSDSDGAAAQMNFGVWGPGSFDRREAVRLNRLLERKVRQLGGHKWLYAHAYYTEAEFWAGYDRASYDGLRARFAADWLPSVYDKVRVDVPAEERARATWTGWLLALFWPVWPLRGLYGVLMTVVGGDYLLKSSASSDVPGFDKDV